MISSRNSVRLLMVTDKKFWKNDAGNTSFIFRRVEFLRNNYELEIFYAGHPEPEDIQQVSALGLADCVFYASSWWKRLDSSHLEVDKTKLPPCLHPYSNPDLLNLFSLFLREHHKFDAILFQYAYNAYLLDAIYYDVLTLVDTHDLFSRRPYRYRHMLEPMTMTFDEEGQLLDRFNCALLCELSEWQAAKTMLKRAIPIYCSSIQQPVGVPFPPMGSQFGYIASGNPLNREGLGWFLDNIWPLYKNAHAKLHIFGDVCDAIANQQYIRQVFLHGRIEDARDAYRTCNIMINPVLNGTGIKIKTLEALAYGRPIITTPEGARGMDQLIGHGIWLARNRGDFLSGMYALANDCFLFNKYSTQGQALVHRDFSPEASMRQFSLLLTEYCNGG